jgi:hypothetical protein
MIGIKKSPTAWKKEFIPRLWPLRFWARSIEIGLFFASSPTAAAASEERPWL